MVARLTRREFLYALAAVGGRELLWERSRSGIW